MPPVAPSSSTTASSTTNSASIAAPLPPFPFFPSFFTPFSIPPPPIPANLETFSTEELRAMEGNERSHVEERLKLLKNVNTMINASIAMMNQYQMIVSNLPPIPSPSITSTSPSTSNDDKKKETPVVSSSSTSDSNIVNTSKVKIEDIGSEDHLDEKSSPSAIPTTSLYHEEPSSSSKASSSSTFLSNEISSSVSGNSGESEEANEIRKRRLQKFLQGN